MTRTVASRLVEAIRAEIVKATDFTGAVTALSLAYEPWASVTFTGARQHLLISFDGPGAVGGAADVIAGLDALEIALPGILLADLDLLAEARGDNGHWASLDLEALFIDIE